MSEAITGAPAPAPAEDTGRALSRAQINAVFVTLLLGMLLSALDQTIVSTALPTIVSDLGGAGHQSWVVTAYLLAETIATVLAGKFGDLFGRKWIFLLSVIIFVTGSILCGAADNLTWLVFCRALQGIGGGGLSVMSTALIADVIPLRERGRYMGGIGAVFGVTTVVGPLLGGVFTQYLSWRWAFYVNVPVAIIVIVLALRTIPAPRVSTVRPRIDYLGVLFVSLGATGLTLATSWGGTQYPWGSPTIIGLFAGSLASLVVFVLVELHAAEPILPMRIFRQRVVTTASILSFIVGFGMLGSIAFLPTFLQYATGASATISGLEMLPMVIGLLVTAIGSGQFVSSTGRYRIFPIAGSAIMGAGLFLLSRMGASTPIALDWLYMLVLGLGIGLMMQTLTLIVQNTVEYRDLGAATSAVTFFRTLGGSFGASILGSIYLNELTRKLPAALEAAKVPPSVATNLTELAKLPDAVRLPIEQAYAQSLDVAFLLCVPVAVTAFIVALLVPQVPLRGADQSPATTFAVAEGDDPRTQLENLVAAQLRATHGAEVVEILRRSGTSLEPADAWGVIGVGINQYGRHVRISQQQIEHRHGLPSGVLSRYFDHLVEERYLTRQYERLVVAQRGQEELQRIMGAWHDWLVENLRADLAGRGEDKPDQQALDAAIEQVIRRVLSEDAARPDAGPPALAEVTAA